MRSGRLQKYKDDSDSDIEKDVKYSSRGGLSDDEDNHIPTVRRKAYVPHKEFRERKRSESEAKGEIEDLARRDMSGDGEIIDSQGPQKFRGPKKSFGGPKQNILANSNHELDQPHRSSWAEKKSFSSNYADNDNDKENDDFRRTGKWNAAKPKDPIPDVSTKTKRDSRLEVNEPCEDSDVVEESKSMELNSESSRFGEILPRKSGRYGSERSDDTESPTTTENSPNFSLTSKIPYVLKAHARGAKSEHVQCTIVRDRSSIQSKMYPTYELYLDDNKKKLVTATKMNLNRTSNYHLFDMTRGVAGSKLSKKSGNYLGKLRARNLNRTEYVLVSQSSEREELAGIAFDRLGLMNHLKDGSQPRKMTIVVPHLDSNKVPIPNAAREDGGGSVLDMLASPVRDNRMLMFESKDPVFENGNYRLNFKGRVSVPSVKNFQLVSPEDIDNVICQFGKIGEDRFHLDFKAPLNAFQAFALALCQFNL